MIQIYGLRPYLKKDGTSAIKHAFFDEKWWAPNLQHLFQNVNDYIAKIPESERWNLYYTVADCFDESGRKLKEQHAIPFDIDGIDLSKIDETLQITLNVLKVKKSQVGVVYSGNGIQIIVGIQTSILDEGHFLEKRPYYKAICDKINLGLKNANLKGKADTSVWSPARLLRLPNTRNIKKDKPERFATLENANIELLNFDLELMSGIPIVKKEEYVNQLVLDRYPTADSETVLSECEFIKFCKDQPNEVLEPQWYAMLSVIGRLKDGKTLVHEYSKNHKKYNEGETNLKLEQALEASGPRTCKNINSLWGNCASCKHFNDPQVVSPIVIRGADYIKTQGWGFHERIIDDQGNPKPGKPAYEDLRKYFEKTTPYFCDSDSGILYKYIGTHWQMANDREITAFASTHFNPQADNKKRAEFLGLVKSTNNRKKEEFDKGCEGKVNFSNGVLDILTMKFENHSKDYGFTYVLPYNYDPFAEAPRFEQFLQEVTDDRFDLQNILLEYLGYSFSNDSCWAQKALILVGKGSNGKSTFLEVLKVLAGKNNYSSLMMQDLKDPANRYDLDGKLFNIAEETSNRSIGDSGLFKNLVTGGELMVKMLYHQPFKMRNRAKLIISTNDYPQIDDTTPALFRRLLLVPFKVKFQDVTKDPYILDKLLVELPGIFNMVIKGYKRLKEKKGFTYSVTVEKELNDFMENSHPVKEFVNDYLEIFKDFNKFGDEGVEHFISNQMLYTKYADFAIERNEDKLDATSFFRLLRNFISDYEERKERKRIGGLQQRGLKGIKLINEINFQARRLN